MVIWSDWLVEALAKSHHTGTVFYFSGNVRSPGGHGTRTVAVAASSDGGAHLGSAQPFTYYDVSQPPTVTSVAPRLLPLSSGNDNHLGMAPSADKTLSLTGGNFAPTGERLRCRFGNPGAGADVGATEAGYTG